MGEFTFSSFMCREGLKGYLQSHVPDESAAAIEAFVDEHTADQMTNPEAILSALQQVRVCDPACGSGAYLLGMLHELLDLRAALFAVKQIDHQKIYDRKLAIIQQNIYGVDIDPFAVNIARLRLWLSLMIEFEGASPPPLPNLDYKIEVGDSLAAPDPKHRGSQQDMRQQLVSDLQSKKAQYIRYHGDEKRTKRQEIEELEAQIRLMTNGATAGFDWAVDFADVFPRGFDIILANPPYIQMGLFTTKKQELKLFFSQIYKSTADIYTYFYARAIELLNDGGYLLFISSNKWFRADYGKNIRNYVNYNTKILSIIDFGELPLFKSAKTFPVIFIAKKEKVIKQNPEFTQVKSLNDPYPDILKIVNDNSIILSEEAIGNDNWIISSSPIRKINTINTIELQNYTKIYTGIKTGLNKAFYIDKETRDLLVYEDENNLDIIKPLMYGDDIRKWNSQNIDFVILTKIGIDIKKYPKIFEYLSKWEDRLRIRSDQGNFWWELRSCSYYNIFEKPKIIYPDIAKESRFTIDYSSAVVDMTGFVIPSDDRYLLGILNSPIVWSYLKQRVSVLGDEDVRGRLRLKKIYMKYVSIPQAADADRQIISSLVEQCLAAQGQGVESLEAQINERVAWLYGLNEPQR